MEILAALAFIFLVVVSAYVYGIQMGRAHDIGGIMNPPKNSPRKPQQEDKEPNKGGFKG